MPVTLTDLPVPAFLSAKFAVAFDRLRLSPATRLSARPTVAAVVPSYTLFWPLAMTVSVRCVMSAVVLAVVLKV